MPTSHHYIVRVTPFYGPPETMAFDLSRLLQHLEKLQDSCK